VRGLSSPRTFSIAIAVLLVAVAIGILLKTRADFHRAPLYAGTPVVPPKFAPDAVLTNQDGRPAHVFGAAAPATFLFFGYTHCPDACSLALASLGRAYRMLPPALAARIRIVFVSVDPERDVPAVMKRYVAAFDAPIAGLTGSRAQLKPVWDDYGVTVDPSSKEISHGDAIYAIDATQHVILIYPPEVQARDLASDAAKMLSP
jgi:protein SCO1/2